LSQRLKTAILFLVLLIASFLSQAAFAQAPAESILAPATTGAPATASLPSISLGRETPKSMMRGFLKAVGSQNYKQAESYLDLRSLSVSRRKTQGPELAKALQTLLDQGGRIETTSKLSDSQEGNQEDGLPAKVDLVGTVRVGEKSIDLLAERHDDPIDGPIWQISRETVSFIPALIEEMNTGYLDRLLPPILVNTKWQGVPVGHWAAIFLIAAVALVTAGLLTFGVIYLIRRVWPASRSGYVSRVLDAFVVPIRIYISLGIFVVLAGASGISIVARQNFTLLAEIAAWLSLWWFLWRIIDIVAHSVQDHMIRENKRSGLSSVIFFRRSARLVLAGIAIALALDRIGWNVTGWFAALGIGGLALVFGAQKTLENFVVGLTLIIDQPLRVGDFCKIGEIKGTVEDIGMRSTRMVTLDGTRVTIPNGTLSTTTIENFALREHFLFHPTLELRHETTPDQLQQLLTKLRDLLKKSPHIEKESPRVWLAGLGKDSIRVEIFSYVATDSIDVFNKAREDLLLRIINIIDECGVKFALPSQSIYFAKDISEKITP
jgi:MscS family membrane protein